MGGMTTYFSILALLYKIHEGRLEGVKKPKNLSTWSMDGLEYIIFDPGVIKFPNNRRCNLILSYTQPVALGAISGFCDAFI